jgi:pimeloyl-ACP methyl ester carboxylesterase
VLQLDSLAKDLNADPVLLSLPELGRCSIRFDLGQDSFVVHVSPTAFDVEPSEGAINDSWDVSFSIPQDAWDHFTSPLPPPGYNTAQAMVANLGPEIVQGNRKKWAQYAPVIQRVLHALGGQELGKEAPQLPLHSQVVGRYVGVQVEGVEYQIFYETAGEGIPLLCLHTAGSDSRQYRYMLEDPDITANYRVVAFDLPWHGRSNPPTNWRSEPYRPTPQWYAATILAVSESLDLLDPVLVGCSMGGAIALYMSSFHGDRFRAVLSLEGSFGNPRRRVKWTRHAEVDHSLFLATWVDGLLSPRSPQALRDEVLWHYSQSGPGVYNGDTFMFGTFADIAAKMDRATCPLYVFVGDYDYSATPEMAQQAAEQLGGTFILMEDGGHFPMIEDPEGFKQHLMPVLDEILTGGDGA